MNETPALALGSDILTLNIGGEKLTQTRRSTLTYCAGSKLAEQFSGRWDELLKDSQGHYFIDHDPETFVPLLKFVRVLSAMTLLEYDTLPPMTPSFRNDSFQEVAFRRLVDSYDLTNVLYNYEIYQYGRNLQTWSNRTLISHEHSILELTLENSTAKAKYFCLDRPSRNSGDCHSRKIQAFQVTLERSTDASIGWIRRNNVFCNDAQELRRETRPIIFSSSERKLHCAGLNGTVVSHAFRNVEFTDESVIRCRKRQYSGELEWFVDGSLVVSTCRALPFGQTSLEDSTDPPSRRVGWSLIDADFEMIPYILLASGKCRFSAIELES